MTQRRQANKSRLRHSVIYLMLLCMCLSLGGCLEVDSRQHIAMVCLGLPVCLAFAALLCVIVNASWGYKKPQYLARSVIICSCPFVVASGILFAKYGIALAVWPMVFLLDMPGVAAVSLSIYGGYYLHRKEPEKAMQTTAAVVACLLMIGVVDGDVWPLLPLWWSGTWYIPPAILLFVQCIAGRIRHR